VVEERRPDRRPRARRLDDADLGHDVVGHAHRLTRLAQRSRDLLLGVGIPRYDDRDPERGPCQPISVVPQHLSVAAVGPPDQEEDVGLGSTEITYGPRVQPPRRDVNHLGAGAEPDPVARLGGHLPLVPHNGQPQPPAGARARQGLRVTGAEPLRQRVAPVENVAAQDRGRLRRPDHGAVRGDEHRLGKRRADVEAQ
jgi:hypothetical protein